MNDHENSFTNPKSTQKLKNNLRLPIAVSGLISLFLGLIVLFGWHLHIPVLIQIRPTFAPMQYNTALGFFLAGLIYLSHFFSRYKRFQTILSVIILLLGSLTLIQYVFNLNFGIDQFFMHAYLVIKTSNPGRMSPITAICFICTGLLGLFFDQKSTTHNTYTGLWITSVLLLVFSGIALIGYCLGLEYAYGWLALTKMAIHTAFGFVVLSIGPILFLIKSTLDHKERKTIGHPIMLTVLVMGLFVFLFQTLNSSLNRGLSLHNKENTLFLEKNISSSIESNVKEIERMAGRISRLSAGISKTDFWRPDANQYIIDRPGIQYISLISPTGETLASEFNKKFQTTLKATNLNIDNIPKSILARANLEKRTVFYENMNFEKGGTLLESLTPILNNKKIKGFIKVAFSALYFETLLKPYLTSQFFISVYSGEHQIFSNFTEATANATATATATALKQYGIQWRIQTYPSQRSEIEFKGLAIWIVLYLGGLLAIASGLVIFLFQRQRTQLSLTKKVSEELQQKIIESEKAEKRFRQVVEAAPNAMIMMNKAGQIVLTNLQTEKLFSYQRSELVGQLIEMLVPERFRSNHPEKRTSFFNAPEARHMGVGRDLFGLKKNGDEVPIEIGLNPIETNEGLFVLASIIDITERKHLEDKLRHSESFLSFALEVGNIGAWDLNLLDQSARRSLEHDKIFGYKELLPNWTFEIFLEHVVPADRNLVNQTFLGAIKNQKDWKFECRILRTDQQLRWICATGKHIFDINGNASRIAGIVQDISEQKFSEEEIRSKNNELIKTNKELDDFAYIVSHDLKAPLRGIGSVVDWLSEDYGEKLDDEGKKHLATLKQRARRLSTLIDGILRYSKIGREKDERRPTKFNTLISDVLSLIEIPEHIQVTVDKDFPIIPCNSTQIEQVFQNLLSNAIRYMDKKKGQINIHCHEEEKLWHFQFSDNGPGIAEEHFERIFKLFQTLGTQNDVEGTGIGLTIVKKIIENHGGTIWPESKQNQGSVFHFTLPKEMIIKKEETKNDNGRFNTSN